MVIKSDHESTETEREVESAKMTKIRKGIIGLLHLSGSTSKSFQIEYWMREYPGYILSSMHNFRNLLGR